MFLVAANTRQAIVGQKEWITTGSSGIQVQFLFSDDWEGLSKFAVFRNAEIEESKIPIALTESNLTELPAENCAAEYVDEKVYVGVYGSDGLGHIIIPTIWVSLGVLKEGAAYEGMDPPQPTPDMWAQILAIAQNAGAENAEEAEKAADEAKTAVTHYPKIVDRYWYVWNAETETWVNTGIRAEGRDGYSPEVTITEIEGGHRVTITDEDHPQGQTFDVMDGHGGSTGDYDELTNRPRINGHTLTGNQSASDLGLGTYSKPASGIPKTDLAQDVQASLGKADTALQTAPVQSVAGKTGAVTLGAGDVGVSSSEEYNEGTVGAELSELNRQLSDVESAMTNKADNSFLYAIEDSGTGKYIRTNGTVVTDTRFYYTYTTMIPCNPGDTFIYHGGSYVAASALYYYNGTFVSGLSSGGSTIYVIPQNVNGVRFQSANMNEVTLSIERTSPISFEQAVEMLDLLNKNKADYKINVIIASSGTGMYLKTDGTVATDTRFYYTYTTIIPCEPGHKFIYHGGSYVAASVLYYNNGEFVSGASYGAETEVTIPSGVNGVRFQSAKLTEVSLDVERVYPITFDVISEANGKPTGALWQNTENGPAWVSNEIAIENPFYQKVDFVTLFDDESKYSLVSDDNIIYLSGTALPQNAFIKTVRFKASASGSGYIAIASISVIASRYLWNVKLYHVEYSEGWNEVTINFSTDGNTDYLIGHLKLKVLYGNYTTLSGTVDTKYMFGGGNYYQSNSANIIYENVRYAFGSVGSNYKCCMAFDAEIYTGTYPEDHDKINKTSDIFTGELLPKYEVISGEIGYVGRWYDYNDGDSTFKIASSDGAYVCFKLSGTTSISIQWGGSFIANSYISYRIDNGELTRLLVDSTGNTISIPDTDEHIVQIVMDAINVANTWYTQGNGIGIKGITTSGTLKAIQPKNRKIIFFGDSLTRGVRALGEETEEEPNCNSSVKSYAWYMSQRLDATPILVGYGSSGVVASGEFGNCMTAINYVAQNIESADLDVDLIVINHGHNDVSVPSQNFKTAYNAVLDRFMTKYPGVPVMCVSPFNNVHSADIKECAESKSWCYFVDTYSLYLDRYYADGPGHLTAQGAEICGAYLANKTKW